MTDTERRQDDEGNLEQPRHADELVNALDGVVDALGDACEQQSEVEKEAGLLREHRQTGRPLVDMPVDDKGGIVMHLSSMLNRLNNATTRLRRAQAKAMREEGATTERIADSLGVTRQRVSALLRGNRRAS